jgi:hypothetical protein
MIALLCFLLIVLAAPFKSKGRLEAENAALRHQLIVLRRKMQGRARLPAADRSVASPIRVKLRRVNLAVLREIIVSSLKGPECDANRQIPKASLGPHRKSGLDLLVW